MIAEAAAAGRTDVLAALRNASAVTGSDFGYLLSTAMRESSLRPQAESTTSSASGLFQFIEQTWLGLIDRYGAEHGLAKFAGAIERGGDGRYTVANDTLRQEILALRQDPQVASLMAGEHARETRASLEAALGREVCCGELYAAHFFGEAGARRLIRLNERNPEMAAADAFPRAANANPTIFYNEDGTSKTVAEIYAWAMQSPDMSAFKDAIAAGLSFDRPTPGLPETASRREVNPELQALRAKLYDADETPTGWAAWRDTPTIQPWPSGPFRLSPEVVNVLAALDLDFAGATREDA